MGAYLSTPVTTKETFEGRSETVQYGGGSMQGWRRTMEDAHIAETDLARDMDCSIFGVFDGHGGAEVAKFCQKYMASEIKKLGRFNEGAIEDSLVEVFHRMDDMLRDHAYAEELEQLKTKEDADEDERGDADGDAPMSMDALEMLKRVFQIKRWQGDQPAEGGPGEAGGSGGEAGGGGGVGAGDGSGGGVGSGSAGVVVEELDSMATDPPAQGATPQQQEQDAAAAGGGGGAPSSAGPATAAGLAAGPAAPGAQQQTSAAAAAAAALRALEPADRVQAGCTAVVAVKYGNDLFVANAGDSRGVLCRGGEAVALSEDHKPAQEIERNRILNAGGFLSEIGGVCRVNGNLNLSRAIGDLKYKGNTELPPKDQIITAQPDVRKISLKPEDRFFLLACDGVWDVMTNQEAVDFICKKLETQNPTEAACSLLDACLAADPKAARGVGCDNMTAVVVMIKHESSSS